MRFLTIRYNNFSNIKKTISNYLSLSLTLDESTDIQVKIQ